MKRSGIVMFTLVSLFVSLLALSDLSSAQASVGGIGGGPRAAQAYPPPITPTPGDPYVGISFWPYQPSSYDTVSFYAYYNAVATSATWDFGDGTTATGFQVTHRYAADGSYPVSVAVTLYDGRVITARQTVTVSTHDVGITRISAPNTGSSGQTRSLTVSVASKLQAETVTVQLLKSVPGGYQQVGTLTQTIPARNRAVDFDFSYTFTPEDAEIGKVTFKAVASIGFYRDALPADNEAVAPATKVNR
ncbi:MAG TPA: PKD domain-containing protein [Roseiflexaceae bacterium]|nr:PKD domain-containing protein [Roseiflexaceae bacterium]